MFIQTQDTPNPETLKFLPRVRVMPSGTATYSADDDLSASPLAQEIFKVPGVKGVFLADTFITITKAPSERWETLKPLLLATIMDHLIAEKPVMLEDEVTQEANAIVEEGAEDVINEIKELIETRVRPAVAQDGGDIVYRGFKDGIVYLQLHGACAGCPSSSITLKSGIENMLKHYVPEVISVEAV